MARHFTSPDECSGIYGHLRRPYQASMAPRPPKNEGLSPDRAMGNFTATVSAAAYSSQLWYS